MNYDDLIRRLAVAMLDYTEWDKSLGHDVSQALNRLQDELEEASPMTKCARCGKEFRQHLMVWEEGDEMECFACNKRENERERAEADRRFGQPHYGH